MEYIVLSIHVLAAIGAVGLILIQQGKGAEAGASFGSGASQTFFGSQGSGNFLTRSTAILITLFFITSLTLGFLASNKSKPTDLDELLKRVQPQAGQHKGEGVPKAKQSPAPNAAHPESKSSIQDNEIPNIPAAAPSKNESVKDADKKPANDATKTGKSQDKKSKGQ